jgi:hypothetical protein
MSVTQSTVAEFFRRIIAARDANVFIRRANAQDKEFHFQNWVKQRLVELGVPFEQVGRNSYPDFRIVPVTEGYEVKGLAEGKGGRDMSFDSNSQMPTGFHNGRTIYYVFGRYPKEPDGDQYPITDLVLCHGDFLDATDGYVHKNKPVRGFGSYGDILIRDRKMYVVPTPFALASNLAYFFTLILPAERTPGEGFEVIGELVRTEAANLVVAYRFDLRTNDLTPNTIPNPHAGRKHTFRAWRLRGEAGTRRVELTPARAAQATLLDTEADDE